jgi:hypothetical protein
MIEMECLQDDDARNAVYAETVQILSKMAMMHTENQLCAECSMSAVGQALGEIAMAGLREPNHEKLIGALLEGYARITGGTVVMMTPSDADEVADAPKAN